MADLIDRITIEPGKCGGHPCIRGYRMRVTYVLGMLAAGESEQSILQYHDWMEPEDIRACLAYAANELDRPATVAA